MKTLKLTYWQDAEYYLGFLNDYPTYHTQAFSRRELIRDLKDLLVDLKSGEVPYVKSADELGSAGKGAAPLR